MALTKQLPTARELQKIRNDRFEVFSTGLFSLDLVLGQQDPITKEYGVPNRTIMEAFGTHMTGKTLLAEKLAKSVLAKNPKYKVVFILTEEANLDRMEEVGLDMDRCLCWSFLRNPTECKKSPEGFLTAEEGLDLAIEYVLKDKDVKLVVVDTVKALVAAHAMVDGKVVRSMEENKVPAALANVVNDFVYRWLTCNNSDAILLLLNQTSESIGSDYMIGGNFKIKTPGGRFKEQQSMIRIKCDSIKIEEATNDEIADIKKQTGLELFYTVIKNKYCDGSINRRAVIKFMFDPPGVDSASEILAYAAALNLIELKAGGWYNLGKDKKGEDIRCQGEPAAMALLNSNPEVQKMLVDKVLKQRETIFRSTGPVKKTTLRDKDNDKKK